MLDRFGLTSPTSAGSWPNHLKIPGSALCDPRVSEHVRATVCLRCRTTSPAGLARSCPSDGTCCCIHRVTSCRGSEPQRRPNGAKAMSERRPSGAPEHRRRGAQKQSVRTTPDVAEAPRRAANKCRARAEAKSRKASGSISNTSRAEERRERHTTYLALKIPDTICLCASNMRPMPGMLCPNFPNDHRHRPICDKAGPSSARSIAAQDSAPLQEPRPEHKNTAQIRATSALFRAICERHPLHGPVMGEPLTDILQRPRAQIDKNRVRLKVLQGITCAHQPV